jgi:cytoskeletal protein RodZ
MSMVTIGEKLRSSREKRSLTVEQVQKQTLIHAPILTALEEGKCDDILAPAYVKGFLKKYALFLGLDNKDILSEYATTRSEKIPANATAAMNIPAAKTSKTKTFKFPVKGALIGLAVLITSAIFVMLIFAGARFLHSMAKKPRKNINILSTKAKKSNAKIQNVKAGESPAWLKAKLAEKSIPSAQTKAIVPKNVPLNVVLKAKSPVWVELKKDGEKQFQTVLAKGSVEPVIARDKVELYIANGEAIEIIINGRSMGSPGKGVIKNLEITHSGMKVK